MKTIEEYAIELVADGAESCAEDDLNESGDVTDEDHGAAMDLAIKIARAIKANPDAVLALVGRSPATLEWAAEVTYRDGTTKHTPATDEKFAAIEAGRHQRAHRVPDRAGFVLEVDERHERQERLRGAP
jgi:hypothetical protein